MSRKHSRNFPRKIIHKRPDWCIYISVFVRGEEDFSHKIFFGAYYGGEAKNKALPKIQSYLDSIFFYSSKKGFTVRIVLKKVSKKGRDGTPTYVLKNKYCYLRELLRAKYPSRVFREQ